MSKYLCPKFGHLLSVSLYFRILQSDESDLWIHSVMGPYKMSCVFISSGKPSVPFLSSYCMHTRKRHGISQEFLVLKSPTRELNFLKKKKKKTHIKMIVCSPWNGSCWPIWFQHKQIKKPLEVTEGWASHWLYNLSPNKSSHCGLQPPLGWPFIFHIGHKVSLPMVKLYLLY